MVLPVEAYEAIQDHNGNIIEPKVEYVRRMKTGLLPHWPDEVLVEWLHWHCGCLHRYACLDFRSFRFEREVWSLSQIPGREAFHEEDFCDDFSSSFDDRAADPDDWLAVHMNRTGTWNTPIVLLDNRHGGHHFPDGEPLKSPYHLLEGHRRLSFLNALRQQDRALSHHSVWVVRTG